MRLTSYLFLAIALTAAIIVPSFLGLYIDYLWFQEVDYTSVFLTILKTKLILAVLGLVLFFAIITLNIKLALRNTLGESGTAFKNISLGMILVFSFFISFGISSGWDLTLLYLNSTSFNLTDPIFQKDISFYFFVLPFYKFIWSIFFYGFVLIAIACGIIYVLYGQPKVEEEVEEESEEDSFNRFDRQFNVEVPKLSSGALSHLAILGGIILAFLALGYVLDRYSILYSTKGIVYGAGYTDIKIQLQLYTALALVAGIASILFFISAKRLDYQLPIVGVALLIIVGLLGSLATGLVQSYRVEPDEFNYEKPYLEHNIDFTLRAYDLKGIKEVDFPARYDLTSEDIANNQLTIDNIRLWDWKPLLQTYKQVQTIRTYYEFNDADIDRYNVNGDYRQVLVSPREFDISSMDEKSQTWVNKHLFYTHGYGIAMSPVRYISNEGLPVLYIQDIPPKSTLFEITRPEIYYGELTTNFAVVNTTTTEFDYPKGDENVYTIYQGSGGIDIGSSFRKALFAVRFNSFKLFVSKSLKKESKILINRDILTRVETVAPFMSYDRDPYIVLSEGKLFWILDGYTVSNKFPYSEPFKDINYLRNSVKVVVDAYNGDLTFYVIDTQDPLIVTYMKIFPNLFKPYESMSKDLQTHIRYPEDLFSVQVEKYRTYHMNDPRVFYNKEDVWDVPNELYEGNRIVMDPYYLITKLPEENQEEFILLLPFTPRGKDNMISWMAARSDSERYGERIVYTFPKEKLIYGPMQVEARIDQDPEISQLFTLWSQVGTRVIRGNLLAIPIEDSLLYIEPIYLRAEQPGALPELKRVIVSFGDKLTMQETLEDALAIMFMGELIEHIEEISADKPTSALLGEAISHYNSAQEYLKEGNWTGYGNALSNMKLILDELQTREDT
jgi:uncharacterized membrane protein (UPF0182 family)